MDDPETIEFLLKKKKKKKKQKTVRYREGTMTFTQVYLLISKRQITKKKKEKYIPG